MRFFNAQIAVLSCGGKPNPDITKHPRMNTVSEKQPVRHHKLKLDSDSAVE